MECEESPGWAETAIAGLHIRGDGATGTRLLGWEGVLPLSVVRTIVAGPPVGQPSLPIPVKVRGV
ncbi:UNVERIFIED_CONTAM: hypothetical protein RKD50_009595 [Streptomyces canus]